MNSSGGDREWQLSGSLTLSDVPACYGASRSWYQSTGLPEAIDLSEIDETDSSTLALLLEWQSWAERDGCELQFLNPPRALVDYAALTDADALLGWSDNKK